MKDGLKIETMGVTAGGGTEIRYVYDACSGELLGMVAKDSIKNNLWCVDVVSLQAAPIHENQRCHNGYRKAMAFARSHFGDR